MLPQKFNAEKATGFNTCIYFHVKDGADYTISLNNGKLLASQGRQGKPTAVISGDARTIYNVFLGTEDMPNAYRSGRINITNIPEVMRLQQTFQ